LGLSVKSRPENEKCDIEKPLLGTTEVPEFERNGVWVKRLLTLCAHELDLGLPMASQVGSVVVRQEKIN
jgi:hypothetical protein